MKTQGFLNPMESRWDSYHSSANELHLEVPMACQVELVCKKNIHKKQKKTHQNVMTTQQNKNNAINCRNKDFDHLS
jgi:hypothetical protein